MRASMSAARTRVHQIMDGGRGTRRGRRGSCPGGRALPLAILYALSRAFADAAPGPPWGPRATTRCLADGHVPLITMQQYKARLIKENEKLSDLLKEETEARQAAETAQIDGVQAIWSKFQKTMAEERDNYTRLEESRKALVRGCLRLPESVC